MSRRREQIVENCRWLLDQEVQIITFTTRKYFNNTPVVGCTRGPSELHHYAAVLPKECSLKSLASSDIEEKIIFKEFSLLSTDGAISALHGSIERRIGTILEENDGRIQINEDEVPDVYIQTDKHTPAKVSGDATNFRAQANQILEDVRKNGEEILDNVRKKSEEIKEELDSARKIKRVDQGTSTVVLNTKAVTDSPVGLNKLTNDNLTLLERMDAWAKKNPHGSRSISPPRCEPKTDPNKQLDDLQPGTIRSSLGLSIQTETPTPTSPDPILTPTTSVASDTTITSRDQTPYNIRSMIQDEIRLALKDYQQPSFRLENSAFRLVPVDISPGYPMSP